jgi:hypothetical protein
MSKELEEKIVTLEGENKSLKAEIKKLEASNKKMEIKTAKATNEVPGVFKSEAGNSYRFIKGHTKTRWNGEVVESTDLLKNEEAMQHLVDINYGGLEIAD